MDKRPLQKHSMLSKSLCFGGFLNVVRDMRAYVIPTQRVYRHFDIHVHVYMYVYKYPKVAIKYTLYITGLQSLTNSLRQSNTILSMSPAHQTKYRVKEGDKAGTDDARSHGNDL